MHNKLIVGQTPLLPLDIDGVRIWGKAEFMNPSGSIKDRPMSNILKRAMENNLLKRGDTLVEATSGNAGISFAMFCDDWFGLLQTTKKQMIWVIHNKS